MTAFFATEYTIHFDDTMAYGSHHFLTGFKFQCASRETFMFGEFLFDTPGVPEEYDKVLFFTSDAYSRNLKSKMLGERVAILLSIEEWGLASARFCYRVIDAEGDPVCAGFQTLVCADAKSGNPIPLPPKVRESMDQVRQIEEPHHEDSFRDCVLAGGSKLEPMFSAEARSLAVEFLKTRYPRPQVISSSDAQPANQALARTPVSVSGEADSQSEIREGEVWVFAGQGAFDEDLLVQRISEFSQADANGFPELSKCESVIANVIGGDAGALFSGSASRILSAIATTPELLQPAIHLQNVLGGMLRQRAGFQPEVLTGHSFGEIAAFGLAGCFDLVTGVHIVCLRARAVTQFGPADGGLMVAAASRSELRTEAALQGLGEVVIAGRNHDGQTVLSGPKSQLQSLKDTLSKNEIKAIPIPSPTSFHHPQLGSAANQWLSGMRHLPIGPPTSPVFTCIGRRQIEPQEDVAEILAGQLLRPFDLQGAVFDLAEAGLSKFVDCGSTGTLADLIFKSGLEGIEVIQHQKNSDEPNYLHTSANGVANGKVAQDFSITSPRGVTESTLPSIAIVGSGCLLPGGASSPEQLFASITEQRRGVVDIRQHDPWWSEDFYSKKLRPDKSTSHLSGRINDNDIQLPAGVDREVFEGFTRFQKILCISIAPLVGTLEGAKNITCLVGSTADGYEDQDEVISLAYLGIDPTDEEIARRFHSAKSSGRMPHETVQEVFDYLFGAGLKITLVDAACASSLYSVALGMNGLENGEVDAVIAGGCFCPGPGISCLFSQFRGTTKTGCRPFDASADGVVFSEGAAFVALRRLEDARQQGLPIRASIRAIGLSSDGRSSSANVPQSSGQILSLERCYANYGIDPSTIQAIEAHGTATSVGDATELETLQQFFSEYASSSIPIHSLKGNLGHAAWAAGTASMIAAAEYLHRRTFPAQSFHVNASEKLEECAGTLRVVHEPIALPAGPLRIAIEGFGFGGANAHLVLENEEAADAYGPNRRRNPNDEDLVIVAMHQLQPEDEGVLGKQFDRAGIKLPEKCIVLPALFDDMDISQKLKVNLTEGVISKLSNFDEDLRRRTSLVLAFQGKTERGVEATARILSSRFRRLLGDDEKFLASLDEGYAKTRPSRAYALQCMMPNVATGRAALLHNLNGPNFVVDAGCDSLRNAFESASMLLRSGAESGTRLVVVSAIDAASRGIPEVQVEQSKSDEFAMAWGVATRAFAEEKGWEVVGELSEIEPLLKNGSVGEPPKVAMQRQAKSVFRKLDPSALPADESIVGAGQLESATGPCPIYTPAWIEQELGRSLPRKTDGSLVVVTDSGESYVQELLKELPHVCSRFLVVMTSSSVVSKHADPRVLNLNVEDQSLLTSALSQIREFRPDAILATDQVQSWDLVDSLSGVVGNGLCEALFLIAGDNFERVKDGQLELLGLFPGGYNGSLHAKTGATAGLVKSILREMPKAQCCVLCTQRQDLSEALVKLSSERSAGNPESEVSWLDGRRYVRRLRLAAESNAKPQIVLNQDSVVVATGGARGVTAVMLESIAQYHRCKIFALGRSALERGPDGLDLEQQEEWFFKRYFDENPDAKPSDMKRAFEKAQSCWEAEKTIRHLKSLGATVEYLQVDVTNQEDVQRVVAEVHGRCGRIDLLIHGAGVQKSMLLQDRTLEDFRRTYSVKVQGLNHLVSAAIEQIGFLPAVHVLTSAYSIFGNDGQHDYCAANETMDRLCDMTSGDLSTDWTSIAWLAWDGIGMTRGSEYRILAEQRKLSGIDAATGQKIFRDVIAGKTGAAINVPVSEAEHLQYQLAIAPSAGEGFGGRMIEMPIDLAEVDCLPYHLVHGIPTLPGAWSVDCFVSVALKLHPNPSSVVEAIIEDSTFEQFVRFANHRSPNVRLYAESDASGEKFRTWLVMDSVHASGELLKKDVVGARATVSLNQSGSRLESELSGVCGQAPALTTRDPYCQIGNGQTVTLSGPFACIGDIQIGCCGKRALIDASAGPSWQTTTPALMLDAAWRVAVVHTTGPDDLFVPARVGRLTLPVQAGREEPRSPGTYWEVRSSQPNLRGENVSWDRTEVVDQQGIVRLLVENCQARQME